MNETLFIFGLVFIIIGVLFLISSAGKAKIAVGGFIGPVPFGFANSPEMLKWVIVFSIVVLLFFLFFS